MTCLNRTREGILIMLRDEIKSSQQSPVSRCIVLDSSLALEMSSHRQITDNYVTSYMVIRNMCEESSSAIGMT